MAKKSKRALIIVLMLLVVVVAVLVINFAGDDSDLTVSSGGNDSAVTDSVTDGFKREHVLSDWEKLNQEYKADYFDGLSVPMDGTNGNPNYLIPGQSENMIPQGITYWDEKDWILVSSYDKSEKMQV